MISIGSGIFNLYYEAVDYFIEDPYIGKTINLYYESKKPRTSQGYQEDFLDNSQNVKTETLKIRMYHSPREWLKVANVAMVAGRVQVIGYMSDAEKLQRCTYITYNNLKYILGVQPVPHGFGSRYFVAFLDIV